MSRRRCAAQSESAPRLALAEFRCPRAECREASRGERQGRRRLPASARDRRRRSGQPSPEDVSDIVKTLGTVAEIWMSDPNRAVEAQTSSASRFVELWGLPAALPGEEASRSAPPDAAGPALRRARNGRDSPYLRLPQQALRPVGLAGRTASSNEAEGIDRAYPRTRRSSTCASSPSALSPTRISCMTNPELIRADPAGERREPRPRHEDAAGGHRGGQGRAARPAERRQRRFKFGVEHGDDPGQGGVPQRTDGADPVRAEDRGRSTSGRS